MGHSPSAKLNIDSPYCVCRSLIFFVWHKLC